MPGAQPDQLVNLLALQAAAYELFTLNARSAADRATLKQSLGQEVEDRARTLIAAARELRGIVEEEPAPPLRVVPAPPAPAPTEAVRERRLNGAAVRDVMMRFREGFTITELAAELDSTPARVRPFLKAAEAGKLIRDTGAKISGKHIYEVVTPAEAGVTGPREHPTHRPPEKEPPAGVESRATGMPVRVAAAVKASRRSRSTPGTRHQIRMRDQRWEAQQKAKEERAEAQKTKAQRDPKWKRQK